MLQMHFESLTSRALQTLLPAPGAAAAPPWHLARLTTYPSGLLGGRMPPGAALIWPRGRGRDTGRRPVAAKAKEPKGGQPRQEPRRQDTGRVSPEPQEEPPPANTWVVDFWPPELGEKKVRWFHDPRSSPAPRGGGSLLQQPQQARNIPWEPCPRSASRGARGARCHPAQSGG